MKLLSRVRKSFIFAALALTLLFAGAFLPSSSSGGAREVSAASAYGNSTLITYYNDAAHTTEVGSRYIRCNGKATTTGTVTPYYTTEIIDVCCGSVPC
jgi:uncharacterized protein (UPF0333 family)